MSGPQSTGVYSTRRDYISYPTNRVVGTVRDCDKARETVAALLKGGFNESDIDVLHGEQDLERLDPTGTGHGFLAQFQRTLIRTFELEEFKHLTHHVEDIRAGRCVIMVLTKNRGQRIVAADILHQHGAEFVGFYGRWAWTDLPAADHSAPSDVPALFAQAWNGRDPDALASLFDEDAEYVNVTGLCWHDRESIRRAHKSRLEQGDGVAIVETADTKVKLLAPGVAVVHARMTFSGEAPRTSIVSFVVHRAGDRWLCASAHHTPLIADQEPNVH